MNKNKIAIIFVTLLILSCGGLYMNNKIKNDKQEQKEFLEKVTKIQEPYIKKYLDYYFNGIETITLTTTEQTPTGTIGINGYINNDKSLDFKATFDSDKPGSNMGLFHATSILDLRKSEVETPAKNMEEILKEERKKKRAEEKTSSTKNWFNI